MVSGSARITSSPDDKYHVQIRLREREMAKELISMHERGILLQVALDYRMTMDESEKINRQFSQEFHDENTLDKVYVALKEAGVDDPVGAVSLMQNAGILFRERK